MACRLRHRRTGGALEVGVGLGFVGVGVGVGVDVGVGVELVGGSVGLLLAEVLETAAVEVVVDATGLTGLPPTVLVSVGLTASRPETESTCTCSSAPPAPPDLIAAVSGC